MYLPVYPKAPVTTETPVSPIQETPQFPSTANQVIESIGANPICWLETGIGSIAHWICHEDRSVPHKWRGGYETRPYRTNQ